MQVAKGTILFVILGVWASAQTPPASDIAAIRSIEETFRTAWLKNDENAIMSLFLNDASLYPGSGKPLKGVEALRNYWFGPSEVITTIDRFDAEIEDVEGTAAFAAVTGFDVIYWSTVRKDGTDRKQFVSKGSFAALYVKRSSQWRIHKRFAASKTEELANGVKK